MIPPFSLPTELADIIGRRLWRRITIGESHCTVFRLTASGQPDLILKTQAHHPLRSLAGEAARLRWLHGRAPVPAVLTFVRDAARDFLLRAALPGTDAATSTLAPARRVDLLADALRQLHAIRTDDCPFRQDVATCLAEAESLLAAGQLDPGNFAASHRGRTPADLLAELVATPPAAETAVFTHGDYCLPNVLIARARLSGFVDLGRAGLGDPCRDLALVGRSLERNLAPGWAAAFFRRYGRPGPDPARLRYFRLLDEFT